MNRFTSALCSGFLGLAVGLVPAIPSAAAPAIAVPHADGFSNVQKVQHRKRHHSYKRHHGHRGHWKGYRGYRHKRHGYRRHSDGYWYPLAAFGLGAIIGGAIASQPRPAPVYRGRALSNAHVQWCYNHYRSYRAADNTFQPYHGPRKQCRSPY